jgi:hypothetical protein
MEESFVQPEVVTEEIVKYAKSVIQNVSPRLKLKNLKNSETLFNILAVQLISVVK